jgi:arginine/serine-rich splicing factor 4/5/6
MRGREGEEALVKAAQGVDGKELHGVALTVEEAKGPKREGPRPQMQRSEHRVRVEGMPAGSTWQCLKDFARGSTGLAPLYTEVVRANPSVGIIEYHRREDMLEALQQIDNTELRGVVVRVYEVSLGGGKGRDRDTRRDRRRGKHDHKRNAEHGTHSTRTTHPSLPSFSLLGRGPQPWPWRGATPKPRPQSKSPPTRTTPWRVLRRVPPPSPRSTRP